ncbi:tetratricopeptide repeat protein [Geobacter sp. DSM 9736]|uniref:tetratricopeptide repeat protein n=1 Tax=Geobacter sp. DSM 9736 TaxID=1277350 RepID=UPI000B4FDF90|nr:tetratricopeptide repeat protein [Geobacter sp. DSM 9736]SNB45736.1 Tetratricopeptide repeat-containing protein [Geobacter sp. DSM 9736]
MRTLTAVIIISMLSGCAQIPTWMHLNSSPYEQRKRLSQAVELVKEGNNASASRLLASICREPGVPGITDEALFRLALLSLRGGDRENASNMLERLGREYPRSIWTRTANPIVELLAQHDDLRNQNRTLKNTNQALTRENKELLQSIERLKHLDLELELKK